MLTYIINEIIYFIYDDPEDAIICLVIFLIIFLVVFLCIKYKKRYQLYNALKSVRVYIFTNEEFIKKISGIDFSGEEFEIKRVIGNIILTTLKNLGYRVEYIGATCSYITCK